MSQVTSKKGVETTCDPLAIDAKRIVAELFPDLSLRTWRRLDASTKCPRGFMCGGRKVWRISDLHRWAEWGFPERSEFETRLRSDANGKEGQYGR